MTERIVYGVEAITSDPDILSQVVQWWRGDHLKPAAIRLRLEQEYSIFPTEDHIRDAMRINAHLRPAVHPDPTHALAAAELRNREDLIPHTRNLLVAAARANPNGTAVPALLRTLFDLLPESRAGSGIPQVDLSEVDAMTDGEITRALTGGG